MPACIRRCLLFSNTQERLLFFKARACTQRKCTQETEICVCLLLLIMILCAWIRDDLPVHICICIYCVREREKENVRVRVSVCLCLQVSVTRDRLNGYLCTLCLAPSLLTTPPHPFLAPFISSPRFSLHEALS